MYNLFFKIFILIITISTLCILGIKPKMHNKIFIYDSSYTIVENENKKPEKEILLPAKEQNVEVKKISNKQEKTLIENKNNQKIDNIITKEEQQLPKKEIRQIIKINNSPKKETIQIINSKPKNAVQKNEQINKGIKQTENQNPAKTITQKETIRQEPKILTEKEEEIAWNIWRSNLQNQIMKDTKLPYIPKGTVFKFSFDVDKYGRLSNIKTWSLTSNYTPVAIQYIAPVIRSYQGKDILDFPKGTQRITTTFTGGWKISDSAIYSTPNDYNDIEKVKK